MHDSKRPRTAITRTDAGSTGLDTVYRTLTAEFRHINPNSARIKLLEAGCTSLFAFSPASSAYAEQAFCILRP